MRRQLSTLLLSGSVVLIICGASGAWAQELEPGPGSDVVMHACSNCHSIDNVLQVRKTRAIDFDDRHVHLAIQANQLRVQQLHFRFKRRVAARPITRHRKPDLDAPGALDYVRVGHDESVVGENDSRARAALPGKQRRGVARVGLVGRHIPGGKDLHHGGTDSIDQGFERHAELAQRDRRGWGTWRCGLRLHSRLGILSVGQGKSDEQGEEREREFSHTFIFPHRKRTARGVRYCAKTSMAMSLLIAESSKAKGPHF